MPCLVPSTSVLCTCLACLPRPFFPVLLFAHRTSRLLLLPPSPPVSCPILHNRAPRSSTSPGPVEKSSFLNFFNEACILIISLFVPSFPLPSSPDIVPLLHSLFFFCALSQAAGSDDYNCPKTHINCIALHLRLSNKLLRPQVVAVSTAI